MIDEFDPDGMAMKIRQQAAEIERLKKALQEVIDFTPNDTDYSEKPTRDECLSEIKHFVALALKDGE